SHIFSQPGTFAPISKAFNAYRSSQNFSQAATSFSMRSFELFIAARIIRQNYLARLSLPLSSCLARSNHLRFWRFSGESERRSTAMPCPSSEGSGNSLGEGRSLRQTEYRLLLSVKLKSAHWPYGNVRNLRCRNLP